MAYNAKILAHANNPSNLGKLDKNSQNVGTGFVGNAACGDALQLQIEVKDGVIIDVKSKTFGCGCAIAATSLATEKLIGRTLDEAKELKNTDLATELDLPKIKIHCSVLAEEAVKRAINNYTEKQDSAKDGTYNLTLNKDDEMKIIHTDDKLSEKGNSSCCESKTSCTPAQQSKSSPLNKLDDKPIFTVSESAFNRFNEILNAHTDALGIKMFCEAGGCAGNSYNLDIVTKNSPCASDENMRVTTYKQGDKEIKFFTPKSSIMFLLGVTVDYKVTDLSAEFQFINPGAKSCGCGASFR